MQKSPWLVGSLVLPLIVTACSTPPNEAMDLLAQMPDAGGDSGAGDLAQMQSFLDPKDYAAELILDPAFPFGVLRRHSTDPSIVRSRWGRHGGPMIAKWQDAASKVVLFKLPVDPKGNLLMEERPIPPPVGVPINAFLAEVVDLAGVPFSLTSYTASGANFPGEVVLYGEGLKMVVDRAPVNGFFGVASLRTQGVTHLFYSALSGIAAMRENKSDNGLYTSQLCGNTIKPGGTCPVGRKLFGWKGFSGPVVVTTDVRGAVFVGASLQGGASSDAVYGLTAENALSMTPNATILVESNTQGTSSLASVEPQGTSPGYVLAKGYDDSMTKKAAPAYAQGYLSKGMMLEKSGALIEKAIVPGEKVEEMTLLSGEMGELWVAVQTASSGVLLQLGRRK